MTRMRFFDQSNAFIPRSDFTRAEEGSEDNDKGKTEADIND